MGARERSDECYVLDLCDEILGERSRRQARFDWLIGDASPKTGRCVRLPVDAYWARLGVIVEYRESQHFSVNRHFDKPHVPTVSGVHRGEQRRIYDERREREIPAHGLHLVVIRYDQLACDRRGRLLRDRAADLVSLRRILRYRTMPTVGRR